MIGVLAVLAILAAVLVPKLIQRIDIAVADQETANLERLAAGLKNHILRNKNIPDQNTWAAVTAAELGLPVSGVLTNARGNPRVYAIDPAFRIGTTNGTLPYTQTNTGSVMAPVSPRLVILSSLNAGIPIPISSGVIDAAGFSNIWNTADGAVPADWTGLWPNNSRYLKMQRLNLASLFYNLALNNNDLTTNRLFSIDIGSGATTSIPSGGGGFGGWFLEGTVVYLYDGTNVTPQVAQVLRRSAAFTFERGFWRGQIFQGLQGNSDNLYDVTTWFLAAPLNANAQPGATPQALVDAMVGFMTNFVNWGNAGFPKFPHDPTLEAVQAAQAILASVSADLIK